MRSMEPEARGGARIYPPARKRWGQNFLVDSGAAARIVEALDPQPGERVLEIGPGRGALTELLVARAGRIAAVELDPELARLLRARFDPSRLVLVEADALEVRLDAIALPQEPCGAPLALVGNLPYNISKPIASKLVRERAVVARAVLMFQREVADRLTARPGGAAYGPITVLVGEAFRVERLFDLPPSAFRPAPKVRSSVLRWTRRDAPGFGPAEEEALRACLRSCFAHRRQTLSRNLRAALPGREKEARSLLDAAGIDGGLRAEAVPPDGFRRLAALWPGGR
jgi:16S rRNA (adenine1518-N6/adenine1519-N6)-dimethyltransferase